VWAFSKSFLPSSFQRINWLTTGIISSFFLASLVLYSKVGFLNRHLIVSGTTDNTQEVWFLAWPAHALRNGLSPFWSSSLDLLPNIDHHRYSVWCQ